MTKQDKENRLYRISSPKVTKQQKNNNKSWGGGKRGDGEFDHSCHAVLLEMPSFQQKIMRCKKKKNHPRKYKNITHIHGGEKAINRS